MTVEPNEAVVISIEFVVPPGQSNSIGYHVSRFVAQMERAGVPVVIHPTPDEIDVMLADVQQRLDATGEPTPPELTEQIERLRSLNRFRHRAEELAAAE